MTQIIEVADNLARVRERIVGAAGVGRQSAHFDLWRANQWQFEQAGVRHIEVAGVCTRCHRETFFSHRGDNGLTGRFGAVMMLRP